MEEIAGKQPAIKKALDIVENIRLNDTERLLYLRRQMAIHEAISNRQGALEEGRSEGRQEGSLKMLQQALKLKYPDVSTNDEQLLQATCIRDADAALAAVINSNSLEELRMALRAIR